MDSHAEYFLALGHKLLNVPVPAIINCCLLSVCTI
uniref:Uncharacterized protein n=1 Tax=Anguilla anguilla TaxID=7936 RepID=A0A0E9RZX2_ANGAN